jgi:hypothetical protein
MTTVILFLRLVFMDMMPYRLILQDCSVDGGSKLLQNVMEYSKRVKSSVKGYCRMRAQWLCVADTFGVFYVDISFPVYPSVAH